MSLQVKEFFDLDTSTYTYLIYDTNSNKAAIIDPVINYNFFSGLVSYKSADEIIDYAQQNALKVEWILETHIHADHLTAAKYLRDRLGAKIGVGSKIIDVLNYWVPFFNMDEEQIIDAHQFDVLFEDQHVIKLGALDIRVLHTPGHTPACVSYLVDDSIFVGDTIFMPDLGTARADFPGGDAATLYKSIKRILSLPGNVRIFVCHDYPPTTRQPAFLSTVAEQNANNIFINQNIGFEEFISKRNERDKTLLAPRLLYPSIQINLRAGDLGKEAKNGKKYIKIPVTMA